MFTAIVIVSALAAIGGPLAAVWLAPSPSLRRGFARRYLMPLRFELWRSGHCYRWLGIRQFKYWLPWSGDLIARHTRKHPLRQGKRQAMLDAAFQNTLLYELIHVFILLPLLPMIILPLWRGAWTGALVSIAVNLLVNVYPIMVQRYNRARLLPLVSDNMRRLWGLDPVRRQTGVSSGK